ncbi:MAG: DNA mismatch repair endonuclease MutL [Oscillospiraceae bacterium]
MAKISLLSKEIYELIAAGEVIERPSSVIKELVENSIDSGADVITVEIKNGGTTYMRVTDNGFGISETDVATAFLRHATSKITSKSDLDSILTLGFRGEALASVSAVSKVEVLTKLAEEQYGTHYVIEGSEEKLLEKSGCPKGTTIVIRDIFYNVPARLKFLKKDVTESNSISSIVNKIALSHPEVSIKLIRDNKQELFTTGDGELYSAIYSVFGKSFAETLLPVKYSLNGINVSGFTVKPLFARANRTFQNYFINGRYVKSVTCMVSLEEAYKNSIMTGKFPACILNIEIPPNVVDVNVHPAKIEVRFSDEKMIFDSVYFAVKNALMTSDMPAELNVSKKYSPVHTFESVPEDKISTNQMQLHSEKSAYNAAPLTEKVTEPVCENSSKNYFEKANNPVEINEKKDEQIENFKYINKQSFEKKTVIAEPKTIEETPSKPAIRIIGEAFLNYIIAEVEDKLLLIDKHAAHERFLFEKIKNQQKDLDCQLFLAPMNLLFSYEEFDALTNNVQLLNKLGFSIKKAQASAIDVLGMPVFLDGISPQDILPEIAQKIINGNKNPQADILNDLYHSIACKSAIKANDKTSILELTALVEKIYGDENIKYCPHGRPVMITLTKKELEKQFKRIV